MLMRKQALPVGILLTLVLCVVASRFCVTSYGDRVIEAPATGSGCHTETGGTGTSGNGVFGRIWCVPGVAPLSLGPCAAIQVAKEARVLSARELLPGTADLPISVVLITFVCSFSGDAGSGILQHYYMNWCGPLRSDTGYVDAGVRVSLWVCSDRQAVMRRLTDIRSSTAAFFEDVSRTQPYAAFSDTAWRLPGRLVFARGAVVVEVGVTDPGGDPDSDVLGLVTTISRRLDAALAGKPEPVPVLPFLTNVNWSTEEQGIEWAWAVKKLHESWGEQGTTLVFVDRNGLPRGIPAKRLGEKEYLVHLKHAVKLLDPEGRIDPHLAGATIHGPRPNYHEVTVLGKQMRITQGETNLTVEGKRVQLDRAVQVDGGFTLVPLSSFAEKALGVKVEFSKHADLPKITLTPGGALGK